MEKIVKSNLHPFLVPLVLVCIAPAAFGADKPLTCADHSIVARAVRTPEGVRAFVQCAYEFVQKVGFEKAKRAFHEDERWFSGDIFVFVDQLAPSGDDSLSLVFPPDPSVEGTLWGAFPSFGSDFTAEEYRVATNFGSGWMYYKSGNHVTGLQGHKITYIKRIDWDGYDAAIGAGIYPDDLPGTCGKEAVSAASLDADPSSEKLQEFVRCAAMELESRGYFAIGKLSADPRWTSNSIYLFGLDAYGNALFSGDPYSQEYDAIVPELNAHLDGPFAGRDVVSIGDAFGETFLHYLARNPATGMLERKEAFVKRAVVYGLPILIGAGYYTGAPGTTATEIVVHCFSTEAYASEPITAVIGQDAIPTSFDAINLGGCQFAVPVTSIRLELIGEQTSQEALIELDRTILDIKIPFPDSIDVPIIDADLEEGTYRRRVTVIAESEASAEIEGFHDIRLVAADGVPSAD